MEFEENNEEFEGKRTRNLKEKHREFFTRDTLVRNKKKNKKRGRMRKLERIIQLS